MPKAFVSALFADQKFVSYDIDQQLIHEPKHHIKQFITNSTEHPLTAGFPNVLDTTCGGGGLASCSALIGSSEKCEISKTVSK